MTIDISDCLDGIIQWLLLYYPYILFALCFPFVVSLIYLYLEKHFGWDRCYDYYSPISGYGTTNRLRLYFSLACPIGIVISVIMFGIISTYIEGYWRW